MAAPVGLWAIRESFKVAFGVASTLASESKSRKKKKRRSAEGEDLEETETREGQEDIGAEDQPQ